MQNKSSILDQLNNFGYGLYLAIIGAIGYLSVKGIKKLLDLLCSTILEKYFDSIRSAVDEYMKPLNDKIEKIEKSIKTDRERQHDAIAKNEGVLNLMLETLEQYDKKLNEKTTINIPTSKHSGAS